MSDEYIPIYKGVAPGKKPKQKNLNTPKPLIVGAVKYNRPMTQEELQAYHKMTPQEQAAVVNQRLQDQDKNAWPKNPMQNQHIVNQAIKNNVSIYPTLPELGTHGYEYQQQNPNRPLGFWENPQRIARFKDYIDKNPAAVLPEWLDKNVVNTAYEYLKYANGYKTPDQWGALQEDSPVAQALKQLPEPTLPSQIEQFATDTNSLENTVNPKDLTLYQRALYGFMTPQPGKLTGGNIAQVGLSAVGTGGGTSFLLSRLGTFFQALGISKNPGMLANPVGLTTAVIFGSATARQMVTGKELGAIETLKWLSAGPFGSKTKLGRSIEKKIDDLIDANPGLRDWLETNNPIQFKYAQEGVQKVFNFLSEAVAGAFGVIMQASAGDDDFQEVVGNLGAAWKAGKLSWTSLGKTANALLPLSEGKPLPEGYMWDISSGESKPVPIPSGFTVGAKALDNLRDQIVSDPDNWQKYKQDFISRFGVEGQLNDFALQTILDPLNVAPYANAKMVELVGKRQGNPALQYAGKFSQGNPVVDAIPFPFNGAVELISGGKLHGSKGFVGAMDAYKNFLQGNIPSTLKGKIPYQAPADYTRFQKMIAGLTDDGLPKRLEAQDPNKRSVQVAKELTPEAKALNFEYTLVDRLFYMNDLAGKDSNTLVKLIRAATQADPALTAQKIGDIFEEVGLARDFMDYREFNSPIGAAVATALKKAVDGGSVAKVIEDFNKTVENRANLTKYARFFGMDEATLLKNFKEGTNFDSLIKAYMADPSKVDAANSLFPNGDTSAMKIDLQMFTNKDNPLPYNDSMLGYKIINSISDSLDGFMKERFGIKDNDPGWMRLSHTMKALQSLAVLSLNPRYMLYNAVNNMITRIASNNYGYIDWDKFVAQYEPSVARQDIQGGFTQDLMNNTDSIFKNKNKTAMGSKFLEGGIDRAIKKVGDIFGFATKGSRWIESVESRQSFAVEYKNAMGKIRRVEIPAEIVKSLPPETVKTLKGILEGSSKVTDVDGALSHINDPVVAKVVIDDVLSKFANSNEKIATNPEFYREILLKTGIYDELINGINGAKNISDLATTFDNIDLHWNDYINKLSEIDIQSRVPDVIAQVKTEGLPAAYSILSDMFMLREQTINGKWLAWDQLHAIKDIVTKDVWSRQYEAQVKINADEFKRLTQWQAETYKGIFEALSNKSPEADVVLKSILDGNENFNKFFDMKNQKWREHFAKDFDNYEARQADFNLTKQTIEEMWTETQKLDADINVVADRAMIAMSGNDPKVIEWRAELTKIRNQMTSEMTNFRKSLEQFTNPTIQQKNELYNKFIQETYMPLQAKLKDMEVQGSHDLFNSNQPKKVIVQQQIAEVEARIAELQKAQPEVVSKQRNFNVKVDENTGYYIPLSKDGSITTKVGIGDKEQFQMNHKDGGFVQGYVVNADFPGVFSSSTRGELFYVEVPENLRGSGKGTELVSQALALMSANGAKTVTMDAVSKSGAALVNKLIADGLIGDKPIRTSKTGKAEYEIKKQYQDYSANNESTQPNPELANLQQQLDGLRLQQEELNKQPFGTTPSVPNQSMIATEGGYAYLQSLLNSIKASAYDAINNPKPKQGIPPEMMPAIKKWLALEKQNLASDKYFAQSWAESQRDFVMLNYTKKTNFDNTLSFVFPYQFWYTNTMRNWALRMVDRPAIFNQYFRYRQAQENMERSGIPSRLEGKMSAFAPYLPDWMGDTLWSDPMAQLYPFSQALQPFSKIMGIEEDITTSAGYALNDMVKAGKISKAQAEEAKQKMTGDLWNLAMSKATDESALSDPSSIVSLLMQPGMQWDILWRLGWGHPEKISPTPALKTGQAIESLLGAKPGSTPLTWLETNARKAIGMSPSVAKYGQFGDYYVERMLSNMAFEGTINSREAKEAMISHQGTVWEEADKRVAQELSLKTPGILPIVGALNGANFWQITTATFQSIFPQGLLPQGELIYKNQQAEYSLAYNKWKSGDKTALTEFYNEHPEYETRSALYTKDPEARLKQFIIGDIWDTYGVAAKANQRIIRDALGEDFEKRFLNGGSEAQAMIPLETLLIWTKTIGNTVPKPEALPDFSAPDEVQNLEMWSEDITKSYDQFIKEREAMFPLYYALQNAYYDLPKNEQSAFLKANPSLKAYWSWKDKYEQDHPEISVVFASTQPVNVSKNPDVTLSNFDSALLKQLNDYYSTGIQLTAGAWELLAYEWEQAGRPYGTIKKWMSKVIEPAITGKPVPQDSFWTDSNSSIYGSYKREMDSLYPNYSALWDTYWSLPKNQRSGFWDANPELAEAQAWKEEYIEKHPELKPILNYLSSKYGN